MYHRVNPERDALGLSVSPRFFESQLSFLASRCRVISLAEAVAVLEEGTLLGEHVVITFDDGYRDNYEFAFPILRRHGLPATIFVTVDGLESGTFGWYTFDQAILRSSRKALDLSWFGLGVLDLESKESKALSIRTLHDQLKRCPHDQRLEVVRHVVREMSAEGVVDAERIMLTWEEAREMQESGLVTIASHTMTHPILTRINRETAWDEIVRSKSTIEDKLNAAVDLFAYPNGTLHDYDEDIIRMLKSAGYKAACSTTPGPVTPPVDLFRLPRVDVTYGMCEGLGGRFSPSMFEYGLCGHTGRGNQRKQ
jgi:peptidoglycan/xylan/chitin deacetylase (PgdA/CDA1 family)